MVAPCEASEERIQDLIKQIRETCDQLAVTLIGGHTEVTPGLPHSMVVGTMLGRVTGKPITTGGLSEGDWIGITKWAGLEGTSILMNEFGSKFEELLGGVHRSETEVLSGDWLSVVKEASLASLNPSITAMHDVTEGGVGEALFELSRASGVDLEVNYEKIPLLETTSEFCRVLSINPLGLIGSGAMLLGCKNQGKQDLENSFKQQNIQFTWIGRAVPQKLASSLPRFSSDEILKAWFLKDTQAVIFDMDGTLVESEYDWPAIRARLEITDPSIIEQLNLLPSPLKEAKWEILNQIENQATRNATLKEGALELLELCRKKGKATALVTNNSLANTEQLLKRFNLSFDVVITRDSGLFKPSGAPIEAAAEKLGIPTSCCFAVGDSSFDIQAAQSAGCGRIAIVFDAAQRYVDQVDLSFKDLEELRRYLQVVL